MKITLTSFFNHKSRLSKYETAIRSAYRVMDIVDVVPGETPELKRIPDVVVIPDGDNSATEVTLKPGASSTLQADTVVKVINKDAAKSVDVFGVACAEGSTTEIRFDGSSFAEL